MSRFLKLHSADPARRFGTVLRRSWPSMDSAYLAAFGANARCTELLEEERWLAAAALPPLPFLQFSTPVESPVDLADRREALWLSAEAEDVQADLQAGTVLLAADELLQTLARGLAVPALEHGPLINGVRFSTLLRTATNAIRYVAQWDDDPDLPFPYPSLASVPNDKEHNNLRRALRNIEVIHRAFGIGAHERLTDPVSFRVLVAVDGQLGTGDPDFRRFARTLIETAESIAAAAGGDAQASLRATLVPLLTV